MTSLVKPRVLVLSAYDAGSHRRWHEQLVASQPAFEWHVLTLPPRYFRWRIRGNALSWLREPKLQEGWDLLVATSMVDLASLKAFQPQLANTPVLLYMHENQFAYPDSGDQHSGVDHQMVNLFSAIVAEQVVFNSEWNKRSFLDYGAVFLSKMPDAMPEGVMASIAEKSVVVPVPIEDHFYGERPRRLDLAEPDLQWNHRWKCGPRSPALRLVWVSRWEYDKGPAHLLAFLEELESRKLDYRLCVLGERFRRSPNEFELIGSKFAHRLVQFGYAESREEYEEWLRTSDVVFSTALHEFQGIAILEAVASGCVPLLPNRLSYPELFGRDYCYESFLGCPEREAVSAVDKLEIVASRLREGRNVHPDVTRFSASALQSEYELILTSMLSSGDGFPSRSLGFQGCFSGEII